MAGRLDVRGEKRAHLDRRRGRDAMPAVVEAVRRAPEARREALAVVSGLVERVDIVLARRDVEDVRFARGAGARVVRLPLAGNAAADRRDRAEGNAVRRGEREAVVERARLAEAEEKDALRIAAVRASPGDRFGDAGAVDGAIVVRTRRGAPMEAAPRNGGVRALEIGRLGPFQRENEETRRRDMEADGEKRIGVLSVAVPADQDRSRARSLGRPGREKTQGNTHGKSGFEGLRGHGAPAREP